MFLSKFNYEIVVGIARENELNYVRVESRVIEIVDKSRTKGPGSEVYKLNINHVKRTKSLK